MLWGVEWTLVFEMAFYLLLAIALACRVDPLVLATPVLLVLAVASIWRPEDGDLGWFYCSPVTLFFLAGMWLARCTRWSTTARHNGMATVVALLSVVFGAVTWASGDEGTLPRSLIFVGVTSTVAVAVTFEPLVGRYVPQWALSGAAASYSLYLTHPVLAQLVPEALERLGLTQAPWPLVVVASVVVSLAAAGPIHRHLEQPMNSAARRLLERPWHPLVGARTR